MTSSGGSGVQLPQSVGSRLEIRHTLDMPQRANHHLHLFAILACLVLILSVDILGLLGDV
jgi:hypothetical protein